ncbi:MAG: WecB/TagA/CpsF family glycosyltransferase [Alteromonadaceae bacterium]|nr:WecB/TagA/CpsF family glycosyltransferase [Alteromonadaceae bacterium]
MFNQYANQTNTGGIKSNADFRATDVVLSSLAATAMAPIWLINAAAAVVSGNPVTKTTTKIDAFGRRVQFQTFTKGLLKNSAKVLNVLKGDIALCGVPMTHMLEPHDQAFMTRKYNVRPGLYSVSQLHDVIGLAEMSVKEQVEAQCSQTLPQYLSLVSKFMFNTAFFSSSNQLINKKRLTIFNLAINNITMSEALKWAVTERKHTSPELGFFVNANSINLLYREESMRGNLEKANQLFADGSGMRLAAKHAGFELNDNINGTDMLPQLCKACVKNNKSLYFLGAKPGIADIAASKLTKKYPGLRIVGAQHGYFDHDNSEEIVEHINESGADIVLVALGSPHQEKWCVNNQASLTCSSVLAVGGLFDYYADAIARAPLWMREMGLEWIWRLMQEPMTKFHRYVVGTPEFLIRTFLLKQAH